MSFTLTPSSFTINGSGQLVANYPNGTANAIGTVVGQAGASGDLFLPIQKSGNYAAVAGDFNGQVTPIFNYTPTAGAVAHTQDAALLYNSTTGQSLAVGVSHEATDTSGNTVTLTAKTGQTINGVASWVVPVGWEYLIIATSATAMKIV